jgi:hypothetical protein
MTYNFAEFLERSRHTLTTRILDHLYELLESLWKDNGSCPVECSAILLGMLMKQMRAVGLDFPRPVGKPAKGKSFLQLQAFLTDVRSPHWVPKRNSSYHECNFEKKTRPWREEISHIDICCGVRFEDFQNVK